MDTKNFLSERDAWMYLLCELDDFREREKYVGGCVVFGTYFAEGENVGCLGLCSAISGMRRCGVVDRVTADRMLDKLRSACGHRMFLFPCTKEGIDQRKEFCYVRIAELPLPTIKTPLDMWRFIRNELEYIYAPHSLLNCENYVKAVFGSGHPGMCSAVFCDRKNEYVAEEIQLEVHDTIKDAMNNSGRTSFLYTCDRDGHVRRRQFCDEQIARLTAAAPEVEVKPKVESSPSFFINPW